MIYASIVIIRTNQKEPLKKPEIVAMADIKLKDSVEIAVAEKNKNAQADGTGWMYMYSIEPTVPVFGSNDEFM
jgi:hypothetical protein